MFEAYKVAVKITLNDSVTQGLFALSQKFKILNTDAITFQRGLDSIKKTVYMGIGLAEAGFLGLDLFSKALKPDEDYAHQLNIMNMAGLKHQEIAEATAAAWKTSQTVLTTTAAGNLKTFMDLRNVFGKTNEAIQYLPELARIQAILGASSQTDVSSNSEQLAYSLAKALDIRGAVLNPVMFNEQAEMMAKVITAMQGRVLPQDYQQLFKYARQATYGLSNQFLYEELPTFMQEMKGTAGSGSHGGMGSVLAAGYRYFVQGIMTQRAAANLADLGLIPKSAILKTTTTGTTLRGGVKGSDLFQADPFQWTQDILLPAIHKKYGDNLDKNKLTMVINQMMKGNQLAAFEILQFALKAQNVYRDQQLIRQAQNPSQAYKMALSNDPITVGLAFSSQWKNVETAFGMAIIPILLPTIITLTKELNYLSTVLREYPTLTKSLAIGFVGLSASMAFGGTLILLATGMKLLKFASLALLVPFDGLIGIIAAIGVTVWATWKFFKMLYEFLKPYANNVLYNIHHTNNQKPSSFWDHFLYIPSHHQQAQVTNIYLDKKQIAQVVTKQQAKMASQQPNHGSRFNGNIGLTPNMLNSYGY